MKDRAALWFVAVSVGVLALCLTMAAPDEDHVSGLSFGPGSGGGGMRREPSASHSFSPRKCTPREHAGLEEKLHARRLSVSHGFYRLSRESRPGDTVLFRVDFPAYFATFSKILGASESVRERGESRFVTHRENAPAVVRHNFPSAVERLRFLVISKPSFPPGHPHTLSPASART